MTYYRTSNQEERETLVALRTATQQALEQCKSDGLKPGVALLQAASALTEPRLRPLMAAGSPARLDMVALLASNVDHLDLPSPLHRIRARLHEELQANGCPALRFAMWIAPPSLAMSGRRFQRYRELCSGRTESVSPDVREGRKVRRLRAGVHAVIYADDGALPAMLVAHLTPDGLEEMAQAVRAKWAQLQQLSLEDRERALLPATLVTVALHAAEQQWDWSLGHRLPSLAFLQLCNASAALAVAQPHFRGRFASARLLSNRVIGELFARDRILFEEGDSSGASGSWLVRYARRDPAFLAELTELVTEATRLFARQRMERLEDPLQGAKDVLTGAGLGADGAIAGFDQNALQQEPLALLCLGKGHPIRDDLPAAAPIKAALDWAAGKTADDRDDTAKQVVDAWSSLLTQRRWLRLATTHISDHQHQRFTASSCAGLLSLFTRQSQRRALDGLGLSSGNRAHLRKRLGVGKQCTLADLARAYLDGYPNTPAEGTAVALARGLRAILPELQKSQFEGLENAERDADTLNSGLADLADLLS